MKTVKLSDCYDKEYQVASGKEVDDELAVFRRVQAAELRHLSEVPLRVDSSLRTHPY